MVSTFERNDSGTSSGQKSRLERAFNRFETGIRENGFTVAGAPAFESDLAQFAGQLRFSGVRMDVAHRVQEFGHLFLAAAHDTRIRVSRRSDAKGRGEIEIFAAVLIPDMHPLSAFPNDRPRAVRFDVSNVPRLVRAE